MGEVGCMGRGVWVGWGREEVGCMGRCYVDVPLTFFLQSALDSHG